VEEKIEGMKNETVIRMEGSVSESKESSKSVMRRS